MQHKKSISELERSHFVGVGGSSVFSLEVGKESSLGMKVGVLLDHINRWLTLLIDAQQSHKYEEKRSPRCSERDQILCDIDIQRVVSEMSWETDLRVAEIPSSSSF
jgi:hypothetical protein